MVLDLTQPLTEMNTVIHEYRNCGHCVGLTTLPPSCTDCLEIWESQTPGTLRACQGNGIALREPLYQHVPDNCGLLLVYKH
jgi:hypothetical protein